MCWMKKLTLIGGAPLSGKTTLSMEIAKNDGAVELSTDSIRDWLKKFVKKEDCPNLFYADGMTAEEFYKKHTTAQSVVDGEIAESKQVEKGLIALLHTAITWDHLVVEGIAVTPSLMKSIEKQFTDRKHEQIIIVDENTKRIEQRIRARGLWGPLDTYPSSLIPTEAEWVILYNQWFKQQAEDFRIDIKHN